MASTKSQTHSNSPSSLPSKSPFLNLPPSIRRLIYIQAGLVRFCPIDLNHGVREREKYLQTCISRVISAYGGNYRDWERNQHVMSLQDVVASFACFYRQKRFDYEKSYHVGPRGPNGLDCICDPLPINLLMVCRPMYREAASILYTENQFKICRTAPNGLTPLLRLGAGALRNLRSLHVRLNACGCVPSNICAPEQVSEEYWDVLQRPCRFCHRTCKCGPDSALSAQDPQAPTVVSEWNNIVSHLGKHLRPNQLRFSLVCDTLDDSMSHRILAPLQDLPVLKSCAIRLGQLPDFGLSMVAQEAVRKLMGLPGVSSKPFPWTMLPYEIQMRVLSYTDLVAPNPVEWSQSQGIARPECCQQCTDCMETCCCPPLHAGYSSQGCQCWRWPCNLFLINKCFRQQALNIAYSMNTFSIATAANSTPDDTTEETDGSVLLFLRSIPREVLAHIRSFRIVFHNYLANDELSAGTPSLAAWVTTLEFMQKHLMIQQLHLTVCRYYVYFEGEDMDMNEDRERDFHQRLAASLAILHGLRHVTLPFPPIEDLDKARHNRQLVLQQHFEKQVLEKTAGRNCDSFTSSSLWKGQGHPRLECPRDSTIVRGPAGERIWPLPY